MLRFWLKAALFHFSCFVALRLNLVAWGFTLHPCCGGALHSSIIGPLAKNGGRGRDVGCLSGSETTSLQLSFTDGIVTTEEITTRLGSTITSNTLLTAEVESWRQYVPLVVSVLVIIDILSGSPAANGVLKILYNKEDESSDEKSAGESPMNNLPFFNQQEEMPKDGSKARIDTNKVADEALQKARNALEWSQEKEKYKTDWDRMEDIRRKMDANLQEIDAKLEERKIDDTE